MGFFDVVFDFMVYGVAGAGAAYFYFSYKKKELLGGFWGGMVIGTIGAILTSMITGIDAWFIKVVAWLMQPKWDEVLLVRVNLITAAVGAFLFVYVLNRINHNRDRK